MYAKSYAITGSFKNAEISMHANSEIYSKRHIIYKPMKYLIITQKLENAKLLYNIAN